MYMLSLTRRIFYTKNELNRNVNQRDARSLSVLKNEVDFESCGCGEWERRINPKRLGDQKLAEIYK